MNNYMYESYNSKSFYTMAWLSFILSCGGMAFGLYFMKGGVAIKGFLAMAFLFSISSCFTLAKVIRDKYEADKIITKVETAKTERLLTEGKL